MKISIDTKPNSKKQQIIKDPEIDFHYRIYLIKPAHNQLANKELIKLLSNHFHISKSKITIIQGLKSKQKIVNIEN